MPDQRKPRKWMSIRTKLALAFSLLVLAISLFIYLYFPYRLKTQAFASLQEQARTLSDYIAFSVSPALEFDDKETAQESMQGATNNPTVAWVILTDNADKVFAREGKTEADALGWKNKPSESITSDGKFYMVTTDVTANGKVVGHLHTGFTLDGLQKQVSETRGWIALLSLGLFLSGLFFVWWISGVLTAPLKRMVGDMQRVGDGQTSVRTEVSTRDEAGQLASSFNQMLSRLEQSRKEISDREMRFRSLVETMTEGLVEIDSELRVIFANPRFKVIIGSDFNVDEKPSLTSLLMLNDLQAEEVRKALRSNSVEDHQFELNLKDKQNNELHLYVSLSHHSGHSLDTGSATAIFTDITHLKRTETNLRFKNRELDTFVYKASHDLKAPLSSMQGLLSIARNEVKDRDALTYISLMDRTVAKMDEVLLGLLEVTWMKQGSLTLAPKDLSLLIHDILESIRHSQGFSEIRCELDLPEKLYFITDEKLIQSILQNLIQNAFKYHKKSGDDRWVRISAILDEDGLIFTVKDNGNGIPDAAQEKIFDMFYRATNESRGSGLGLYIVRNACEKLGGSVTVASQPKVGSSFLVRLPVREAGTIFQEGML
jgi:PAS domain S-box-containing protein